MRPKRKAAAWKCALPALWDEVCERDDATPALYSRSLESGLGVWALLSFRQRATRGSGCSDLSHISHGAGGAGHDAKPNGAFRGVPVAGRQPLPDEFQDLAGGARAVKSDGGDGHLTLQSAGQVVD